jgi:hypothetical protein
MDLSMGELTRLLREPESGKIGSELVNELAVRSALIQAFPPINIVDEKGMFPALPYGFLQMSPSYDCKPAEKSGLEEVLRNINFIEATIFRQQCHIACTYFRDLVRAERFTFTKIVLFLIIPNESRARKQFEKGIKDSQLPGRLRLFPPEADEMILQLVSTNFENRKYIPCVEVLERFEYHRQIAILADALPKIVRRMRVKPDINTPTDLRGLHWITLQWTNGMGNSRRASKIFQRVSCSMLTGPLVPNSPIPGS